MRKIQLVLLAICSFASPALAQDWRPREIAANVAEQIEDNYFDANRGTEVGAELRDMANSGAFDAITDPFMLSSALTDVIAPYDGHFRVTWSPEEGDASEDERGRELYDFGEAIRRGGYGFRSISILPANIGYIEMTNFADIDFENSEDPARQAVDGALALVASTDAIIVDLRGNGGGSPAMVGYLVSAFTPPDANIYNRFIGREGETSEVPGIFYATPRLDVPLYILVSARTGSAAESFAYTLKAARRATVIGEATAGAANPGGMIDAGHGFQVFVSFGTPRNPVTGTNWEGDGVEPDIEIPAGDALVEAQRRALDRLAETAQQAYQNDIAWARSALDQTTRPAFDGALYAGTYGHYRVEAGDGEMLLHQGRRPAAHIAPLGSDLFYNIDNPLRRYRFVREGDGEAVAIEFLSARGSVSRVERTEQNTPEH